MEEMYRLVVIGTGGMYTYGDLAGSPDLARLAPGALTRGARRLGVERVTLDDEAKIVSRLLVEAEAAVGEWHLPSRE